MTTKKLMQAAAGNAGDDKVYVEDVFSTHLSVGTGSAITVNNGIDLSGEGGLVIWRRRDGAENWAAQDTERGVSSVIYLDATAAEQDLSTYLLASFNNNGFTTEANAFTNGGNIASWTFRKQEGFFDIVTYTGDTSSSKQIAHNLGSTPACILIKRTDDSVNWLVYHKDIPGSNGTGVGYMSLNTNDNNSVNANAFPTQPTSTHFTVNANYGAMNASGASYIAYLFAGGNDSASQIFGDDGDEAIIKTGSFSHTSGTPTFVNCGFEPAWVMVKRTNGDDSWWMADDMRGFTPNGISSYTPYLAANTSAAEGTSDWIGPNSKGFDFNYLTADYVYIAIRRGPMKEPDTNTDVLGIATATTTAPLWKTGNTVDLGFYKYTANTNVNLSARLLAGRQLKTNTTAATTSDGTFLFDYQTGFYNNTFNSSSYIGYGLQRFPKVFDVVVYSGSNSALTVNHNLGVKPELIISKCTNNSSPNWAAITPSISDIAGGSGTDFSQFYFNLTNAGYDRNYSSEFWLTQDVTSTQITYAGNSSGGNADVNYTGYTYTNFLFASLDGISKVGTYSGTGNDLSVTGLGAAARFVLIKRTDNTGDWYVFDTTQGISSGNDPYFTMNGSAQVTGTDYIDPHSSGFTITSSAPAGLNASGGTYLYLAFA